jgi:hypothetical protein
MNSDDGIYDLIIPGGGPGALTAGLYAMSALGKEHESGACQSALSRFENNIPATSAGLKALEESLSRSAGTLLRRRNRRRLIIDVDSRSFWKFLRRRQTPLPFYGRP